MAGGDPSEGCQPSRRPQTLSRNRALAAMTTRPLLLSNFPVTPYVPPMGAAEPLVLVVDRDEAVRIAICDLVAFDHYRAICFSGVSEASAAIAEETPAVILLDWEVRDDVAHKRALMRRLPRGSSVILMSTNPEAAADAAAYNVPFLPKPFDIEVFLEKVSESARRGSRPSLSS